MFRAWFAGAFALALLVTPVAATVFTTTTFLTPTEYVDLGPGPADLQVTGPYGASIIVSDAKPPSTALGQLMAANAPVRTFCQTSHIWGLGLSGGSRVNVTPTYCGSGGQSTTNPGGSPLKMGTDALGNLFGDSAICDGLACAVMAAVKAASTAPAATDPALVVTISPNGGVVVVAPYAYTPLSPEQHNVALTSSTSLTVPAGTTYVIVQAKTANVEYTMDGTTTPTPTVGMLLTAGASLPISGAAAISNFRAIAASAGATLDAQYFK